MFALDNLAVHAGLSGKGYDVHHCRSLISSSEVILVLGGGGDGGYKEMRHGFRCLLSL